MRLHRLRLRDFRGIADRTVTFAETGVTVVQGANEAGKSSMIEALDLLLGTRSDSKAARVRAVMPAGSDTGSLVEAEISCGEHRFVYAKQFNRRTSTTVAVVAPRRENLSGRDAERRVDAILEQSVDSALFAALRVLQGDDPALTGVAASAALSRALDRAAGEARDDRSDSDPDGPDSDRNCTDRERADATLIDAVAAEYRRYRTPGQGRPTGELAAALARSAECIARHDTLTEAARTADADAEQLRLSVRTRTEVRNSLTLLRADRAALADEERRVAEIRSEEATAYSEVRAATQAHELARRDVADRERLDAQIARDRSEAGDHAAAAQSATERATRSAEQAAETEAELTAARSRLEQARTDLADARVRASADSRREQVRQDLAAVGARIDQLSGLDHELAQAREELAANTVDAEVLRVAEAVRRRVDEAGAALAAATATVVVEQVGDAAVTVDGAAVTGRTEFHADDDAVIESPGVRVSVRRSADAGELAGRLDQGRREADELCRTHGLDSLGHAAQAAQRRAEAQYQVDGLTRRRTELLAGRSTEELAAERDQLAAESAELGDQEGAPPVDPDELAATERELIDRVARAERTAADHRYDERSATDEARAAITARDAAGRRADDAVRARTEVAGDLDDDAARATVQAAADHLAGCRRAHDVAADRLAALDAAGLEARRDRMDAEIADLADRAERADRDATAASARVELYRTENRLDDLADAAAAREAADSQLQRVTRRADAAAVLYRTLNSHRDIERARHADPFARRLEEVGERVFGPGVRFEVDDSLTVRSRTLDGVTVDIDALSGGAREQVGLLARLACAMLVDPADGVPVVIDDALGYSDPDRLSAMAGALAEAGRSAQVIVLTCDPQRYRDIDGAETVAV